MVGGCAGWPGDVAVCPAVCGAADTDFGRGACAICGAAAAINAAVVPGVNSGPGWYGAVGRGPSIFVAVGTGETDGGGPAAWVCSTWGVEESVAGSADGTSCTSFLK